MSLLSNGHLGRDFKIITFDGGPGGGKSTMIQEIARRLRALDWNVYVLAEAATELFIAGFAIDSKNDLSNALFQEFIIKYSLARENCFVEAVRHSVAAKKVLLLDRSIMTNLFYAGPELFDGILKLFGLSRLDVRNRRSDAVFHLQSSACFSDELYLSIRANNRARTEDSAEARFKDGKTCEANLGHHHLRIIPAMEDRDKKFDLLWRHVQRVLGIPKSLEIERKFLVEGLTDPLPIPHVTLNVSQTYLEKLPDGTRPRIRMVSESGFPSPFVMYRTVKKRIGNSAMSKEETEEEIDSLTYSRLFANADPTRKTVIKSRTYFVYSDQCFELDDFRIPYDNLHELEIELLSESDPVDLPPFFRIIKEVTGDPNYSNNNIAKLSLGRDRHL